ncbi:DUF4197 family protein [Gammaproteobacteria bacterium]
MSVNVPAATVVGFSEMLMKKIRVVLSAAIFCAALPVYALSLADLSNQEAGTGLREALSQGAEKSVEFLGKQDGFLGNAKVKIPLPDALRSIESGLRLLGLQRQADELIVAMNRAAEAAIPEAKALLVDAVKKMTLDDAKKILTGGDTSATDFFRRTTSSQLAQRFLPIVSKWTSKVGLAEKYNAIVDKSSSLGLTGKNEKVENYVTRKALDGLYLMIGEQERAIRKNPMGAASGAAQKVFGLLGR